MLSRRLFLGMAAVSIGTAASAQPPADPQPAQAGSFSGAKWRNANTATRASFNVAPPTDEQPPLRAVPSGAPRQSIARVTKGTPTLPADAGQEWREYDISPYTARVTSTSRPEQAILDWILRETGYEAWHTEPLSLLSANRRALSVYHTPEMHAVVSEMVDRFVNTEAESHAFGMRIITIGSPDWRAPVKTHRMLHEVKAQSPGIQAWLLAKEDAALLVADLARRSDFKEHSTPHLLVNNGQSTQVATMKARNYIREVVPKSDAWPGFEPQMAQFDEGFKLEFSPLLSLDGKVVDAIIKGEIDQVEKMHTVMVDVPTSVAPRQRTKIEVPQAVSTRLHERFRWPADQVLLISLGVVLTPTPPPTKSLAISVPLISSSTRADFLVFVESKGRLASQPSALQPGQASKYRERY